MRPPVAITESPKGTAVSRITKAEKAISPPTQRRRSAFGSSARLAATPPGGGSSSPRPQGGESENRELEAVRLIEPDRPQRRGPPASRQERNCSGHRHAEAEQQATGACQVGRDVLRATGECEVELDGELRQDGDEGNGRNDQAAGEVDLGRLARPGEDEGSGYDRGAVDHHLDRRRRGPSIDPHHEPGRGEGGRDRQSHLPGRESGQGPGRPRRAHCRSASKSPSSRPRRITITESAITTAVTVQVATLALSASIAAVGGAFSTWDSDFSPRCRARRRRARRSHRSARSRASTSNTGMIIESAVVARPSAD